MASYTRLRSTDKPWISGRIEREEKMTIPGNELCMYTVLYFKRPDSVTIKLVKDLEKAISRGFETGRENSKDTTALTEQLRGREVLILTRCSPT